MTRRQRVEGSQQKRYSQRKKVERKGKLFLANQIDQDFLRRVLSIGNEILNDCVLLLGRCGLLIRFLSFLVQRE